MKNLFLSLAFFLTMASVIVAEPVSFKLDATEFHNNDSIKIESVESDTSSFKEGSIVVIKGSYTLNSKITANLSFFQTSTEKKHAKSTIANTQTVSTKNGTHNFILAKKMVGSGYPHVTFYNSKTGKPFGGIYFGNEKNLLKTKTWSYAKP